MNNSWNCYEAYETVDGTIVCKEHNYISKKKKTGKPKVFTLEHRRELKDGELVTVDLSIACGAGGMKDGVVVGKSTTGLLDYYMVDFGETFPSYPYKVVNIPHIAIVDE